MAPHLQHSRWVLAMVRYMLPSTYQIQPAIVFGTLFIFIPSHQARTNLSDALSFLKCTTKDCIILVSMPVKLTYSPQPQRGKYLILLPISGNPDIDRVLYTRLLPSLKHPKTELISEPALLRGQLWKKVSYVEHDPNGVIIIGWTGKPLCQELAVSLVGQGGKLEYTSTELGHVPPLTLAACHPSWDDYLDLNETITEMAYHLMEEDGQEMQTVPKIPKAGTTPKQKEVTQVMALLPNDDVIFVLASDYPGTQGLGSFHDNPVLLSSTTEVSVPALHGMKDVDTEDKAKLLGHFSNSLHEIARSIMDLEDSYFKALHEVIVETEKALCNVSCIDIHYSSHVVTVMTVWQEVVQVAASHMDNVNTTIYLACHEDARRATKEYVAAVIQACEECDAPHAEEQKAWKEAIKGDDLGDPVVHLLLVTCKAACTQAKKAIDPVLTSFDSTLRKRVPVHTQGPLISNALSMAFQFQMSIWHMVGDECIHPLQVKHSHWCGLAGIAQAIVEMFPKNCTLMFPPLPAPALGTLFTSTFKPPSSNEDDDDNTLGADPSCCRFDSTSPMPSGSGRKWVSGSGRSAGYASTPLPRAGAFILASDSKRTPSSALGAPPADNEERGWQPGNEEVDMGLEADGLRARRKHMVTSPCSTLRRSSC